MAIYVPIVMYGLRLFYKNYIVLPTICETCLFHGHYGYLNSFVSQLCSVIEIHELKLKKNNNKMKNSKNELVSRLSDFGHFWSTPIF